MTVWQYLKARKVNEMIVGLCAGEKHRGYERGSMCRERVYVMTPNASYYWVRGSVHGDIRGLADR